MYKGRKLFGADNPAWKGGFPKCIDCNKTLAKRTAKRCRKCSKQGTLHNRYGIRLKYVTSSLAQLIRGTVEYRCWREAIFYRDNFTCQECRKHGGYLEADHIEPFSNIFSVFLKFYSQFSPMEDKETLVRLSSSYFPFWDIENGRTLCEDCHKKTETYGNKKKYSGY